ncbi:hypothetical protein BDV38DRAFT_248418 [Aspergillus pseudotamarii]|uniref:Uncharacterized protein n=1 Tax=Aspergillus pseudotamarii TaxID=132259 RepID=A0A5N6SUN0_ASPPS|nr:uncharacterized protein BDV38DRAFT_248418 [Aspergillus pseudotamarii]KAE8136844.1 hypothetical protein BDV38DRAFT_248418 [Aspergillus pseudotamarii]
MQLNNKISVALLAALAAGSEASHARNHKLFHARNVNSTVSTSSVFVYPTPLLTPSSSVPASSSPAGSSPVASSAAGSSSIAASSTSDASSSVITQAPPLSTGVPGSSGAGNDNTGSATDITITYTLGTGTTKSVVTTTIHKTATNTETIYTKSPAVPSAGSEEQTTTLHSTSTSTLTVVDVPTSSAAPGNAGNDGSEACTGQATVTVTATVTETVTGAPSATAKPGDDYTKPHDQDHQEKPGNSGKPGKNSGNNDEDENDQGENNNNNNDDNDGAESTKAPLPVPTHTGRPPFGNGTLPITTSGVAKPTGFLTSSKHAFPTNFRRSH